MSEPAKTPDEPYDHPVVREGRVVGRMRHEAAAPVRRSVAGRDLTDHEPKRACPLCRAVFDAREPRCPSCESAT